MNNTSESQHQKDILNLADRYQLATPLRAKGTHAGNTVSFGTGNSIEIEDRKDYVLGDDIRHVDWRSSARGDRWTVKLYREEVLPRVVLLIDTSASMVTTNTKKTRLLQILYLLEALTNKLGSLLQIHTLDPAFRRIENIKQAETLPFQPEQNPIQNARWRPAAREGAIAVLISDFLFPFDPADIRKTFHGVACLHAIQILSNFEANPQPGGEARLVDAESETWLDIPLSKDKIEQYKAALSQLQENIRFQAHLLGGAFATTHPEQPLDQMAKQFLKKGILTF